MFISGKPEASKHSSVPFSPCQSLLYWAAVLAYADDSPIYVEYTDLKPLFLFSHITSPHRCVFWSGKKKKRKKCKIVLFTSEP